MGLNLNIKISKDVRHHKTNPDYECLTISFSPDDPNVMIHRGYGGRIYNIDYMPKIEEMIEIIKAYKFISHEFKEALKSL